MISDRCQECGSPVKLNHELELECTRNAAHAFGGPGSGWHATAGHVPGSQGGKTTGGGGGGGGAADKHRAAGSAHREAGDIAEQLIKASQLPMTNRAANVNHVSELEGKYREAMKKAHEASTAAGGDRHFAVQAAKQYGHEALHNSFTKKTMKTNWTMASQHHKAAARAHDTMAELMPKDSMPKYAGGKSYDPKKGPSQAEKAANWKTMHGDKPMPGQPVIKPSPFAGKHAAVRDPRSLDPKGKW